MMNRFFLVLLTATLLAACSGKKQESGNTVQDSSPVSVTTPPEVQNVTTAKRDTTIPYLIEYGALKEVFKYKGTFDEAWRWFDKNGENILIISTAKKTVEDKEVGEEMKSTELFARHYVVRTSGATPEILWDLYDLEKDCIFDLTAKFISSPLFTDLDNDQIKESFLIYKLACRSDVSPARMKIVAHENKDKYALRGMMYISMNPDEDRTDIGDWEPDLSKSTINKDDYMGAWGKYENTKDFVNAPPAFLEYAKELWMVYYVENMN